MNVSVIITCWRRFDYLVDIIDAWAAQPNVNQVILWDNSEDSGGMPESVALALAQRVDNGSLWWIRSSMNFGSSARYALASLARNETLLFADDDVMPHPGLLEDLLAHYSPDRMIGVKGRLFHGDYHGNEEIRSERMAAGSGPVEVDMLIGHVMLTHRNWLIPYSFADAAWYCCELELQGRINADVRAGRREGPFTMFVVPTINHHDLPAQTDHNALYKQPAADAEKRAVFERYFRGRCLSDVVPF